MNRIRNGYEARFELLLRRVGARRVEQAKRWLLDRAHLLVSRLKLSEEAALTRVHDELLKRRPFRQQLNGTTAVFFCDAGLGGLARWLRAAGYDALWEAGVDDSELVRRAGQLSAVLLTTDSMLMERRPLRDGLLQSLWLPPNLPLRHQLATVLREFDLPIGEPRCMNCGGELHRGDKEVLKDRIPPRTYQWLNQYFICGRCGKLFWHGTHWDKIKRELQGAASRCAP